MNNNDNGRFHDNSVTSGAVSQYGDLHPATGGGFVFTPNKEHGFLNVIRFDNPNIDKVKEYLEENIKSDKNQIQGSQLISPQRMEQAPASAVCNMLAEPLTAIVQNDDGYHMMKFTNKEAMNKAAKNSINCITNIKTL